MNGQTKSRHGEADIRKTRYKTPVRKPETMFGTEKTLCRKAEISRKRKNPWNGRKKPRMGRRNNSIFAEREVENGKNEKGIVFS